MKQRLAGLVVAALLLTGCTGATGPEVPPAGQRAPSATPSPAPLPLTAWSDLESIPIPWPADLHEWRVAGLHVSPDGKAYAVRFIYQLDGLLAWREGDKEAVLLSKRVLPEVAWTNFGLYFVQLTAVMEGQPQLMRYTWGEPGPVVVLGPDQLQGYPRALHWSPESGLVFADQEGPKRLVGDQQVERPKGPPVAGTLRGEAFASKGLRYITVVNNRLVLASAVDGSVHDLGDLGVLQPGVHLLQARWDATGQAVAVQAGKWADGRMAAQVARVETPDAGPPRLHPWQEGTHPVMLNGTLYFVDSQQTVQAQGAKDVAPVARFDGVLSLTADPAGRRLFAVPAGAGKGERLFYLRR